MTNDVVIMGYHKYQEIISITQMPTPEKNIQSTTLYLFALLLSTLFLFWIEAKCKIVKTDIIDQAGAQFHAEI